MLATVTSIIARDARRARSALLESIAASVQAESTRDTSGVKLGFDERCRSSAPEEVRRRGGSGDGNVGVRTTEYGQGRSARPPPRGTGISPHRRCGSYRGMRVRGVTDHQSQSFGKEARGPVRVGQAGHIAGRSGNEQESCDLRLVRSDGLQVDARRECATRFRHGRQQGQDKNCARDNVRTASARGSKRCMKRDFSRQQRLVTGAPSRESSLPSSTHGKNNGYAIHTTEGSLSGPFLETSVDHSVGEIGEIPSGNLNRSRDIKSGSPPRQPSPVRRLKLALQEMGEWFSM